MYPAAPGLTLARPSSSVSTGSLDHRRPPSFSRIPLPSLPAAHQCRMPIIPSTPALVPKPPHCLVRKLSRGGSAADRICALERDNALLRTATERTNRQLLAERAIADKHRRVSARQARTILRLQALVAAFRNNTEALTTLQITKSEQDETVPGRVESGVQTEPDLERETLVASEIRLCARVSELEEEVSLQCKLSEITAAHSNSLEESYEEMLACKNDLIGDLLSDLTDLQRTASAQQPAEGNENKLDADEEAEESDRVPLQELKTQLAEQNERLADAARNAVAATNPIVALEAAARHTDAEHTTLRSEVEGLRTRVAELEAMMQDAQERLVAEEEFLVQLKEELKGVHDNNNSEQYGRPALQDSRSHNPLSEREDAGGFVNKDFPSQRTGLGLDTPPISPLDPPPTAYYTTPSTPISSAPVSPAAPASASVFRWPSSRHSPRLLVPPVPYLPTPSLSTDSYGTSSLPTTVSDDKHVRALETQLEEVLLRCAAAEASRACSDDVEEQLEAELRAARAENARLRHLREGDTSSHSEQRVSDRCSGERDERPGGTDLKSHTRIKLHIPSQSLDNAQPPKPTLIPRPRPVSLLRYPPPPFVDVSEPEKPCASTCL